VFNLSGSEIVFLIIIALVVLGPDKLPDAMRKAGKAYGDFKRMTTGFQSEMKSVLDEPMRELRETAELAKASAAFDTSTITKPLSGVMSSVKDSVKDITKPAAAPVASGNMAARKPAEPTPAADGIPGAEQPAAAVTAPAASAPASSAPPLAPKSSVTPATSATPTASAPGPGSVSQAMDATSRRLARMRRVAAESGNGDGVTPAADAPGEIPSAS
jgi:sec-independent protein translocase protein TatB